MEEMDSMKNAWTFDHVSMTFKDINKGIKYYQSIGAMILKEPAEEPGRDLNDWRTYGKIPSKLKFIGAQLQLGSLHLEIHQPVEGVSLWQEFLEGHGEGVDHVCFRVDDIGKEARSMVKKGFRDILSINEKGEKLVTVFSDTRQVGNMATQLYQGDPLVAENPSAIRWTFAHVGLVVKDINKAIEHFKVVGAVLMDEPVIHPFGDLKEWKVYGKTPTKLKFKGCSLQLGQLVMELHQPIEGTSTYQDYLNKYGEGVDHIAFEVDGVKTEVAKMVAKGFPIVLSVVQPGDKWVGAYLDTGKVGNLLIELNDKALEDGIRANISAKG
jgi:methylmalonyl-CoA/ethylmalonyl-CoA epimerase